MKLTDLEPVFYAIVTDTEYREVDSLAEADGIRFLCPVCFKANQGPAGTHGIMCWRPHVPQSVTPGPGRWEFTGLSFADLSLVAGSSSVLLPTAPCRAHFFVQSGQIVMC